MMKNKKLGIFAVFLLLSAVASATDTIVTDGWINTTGQANIDQEATSGIGVLIQRDLAAASTDSQILKVHNDNADDDMITVYVLGDGDDTAATPLVQFETTHADYDVNVFYVKSVSDASAGDSVVKIEATLATHDEELLELANAGSGVSLLLSGTTKSISDGTAGWALSSLTGFVDLNATGIITDGTFATAAGVFTGIASLNGGGTIDLEDNLDGTGFAITGDTLVAVTSVTSPLLTNTGNVGITATEQIVLTPNSTATLTIAEGTAGEATIVGSHSATTNTTLRLMDYLYVYGGLPVGQTGFSTYARLIDSGVKMYGDGLAGTPANNWARVRQDSNVAAYFENGAGDLYVDAKDTLILKSEASINFLANDLDDYYDITTDSNVPRLNIRGGTIMYISSDTDQATGPRISLLNGSGSTMGEIDAQIGRVAIKSTIGDLTLDSAGNINILDELNVTTKLGSTANQCVCILAGGLLGTCNCASCTCA